MLGGFWRSSNLIVGAVTAEELRFLLTAEASEASENYAKHFVG